MPDDSTHTSDSDARLLPMLGVDLLRDAQRQLEVCNACRYCEGICAVFPAIERRRSFAAGDISFLAHLCHDCRSCYYVCPYAPPHEFAVNIPKLMSTVRERTYDHYAWPRWLARMLADRGPGLAVVLVASLFMAIVVSLVLGGVDAITTARTGPGSFYHVIPWLWMFLPATLLTILGTVVVFVALRRYWRDIGASVAQLGDVRIPLIRAVNDAGRLRYLEGGGPGCDYPKELPSRARKWSHQLVFWGFMAAFVSTTLAFVYQEFFGMLPPYDYTSLPVVFGTAGGIAMIVGGVGLIALKTGSDREPSSPIMIAKDYAFAIVLLLVSVTGLQLLVLRDSIFMPLLLDVHLGLVLAFYLTAPYGKLVHAVYRTAALARDHHERRVTAVSPQ